ncbi:MAG: acetoacetate--CoA ligase [Alphaproteobacteria bacterium]|nr:acetoacetate--CoA ligase [Alphaproteobacteria bacterium]
MAKKDGPLWAPSESKIQNSLLQKFMDSTSHKNYKDLYEWSITSLDSFWQKVWDFCNVKASTKATVVLKNATDIQKAEFFSSALLNYAENLLKRRDDAIAIYFYNENQQKFHLSYAELYDQVSQVVGQFQKWGVEPGDIVASYMPNLPETVIAMLAAASIGAIWTSCSPDFGTTSLIDRFSQVRPKILLVADGYTYQGKIFNCIERVPEILKTIPSIEHTIIVPYLDLKETHPYTDWRKILKSYEPAVIEFKQLPFNHPLFILYSSGTTGIPKCIVHGAGGSLLQHLKEHQLHCDIKPDDKVFYYTTCGWMMWNWLISALASDASLVLYEGSPTHPTLGHLFQIAEEIGVTLFGTSAKYLSALEKAEFKASYDLDKLKTITSTGSPLTNETFEYVYKSIKKDVHLASISGGTDIISCFMLGNPLLPVWPGQLQGAGLGMKVEVFDDNGSALDSGQGELVCTAPFPSRPLGFWNDESDQKYTNAYFGRYPNVWHHGDFIERTSEDGFIIYGRSDATLNPGGVRIGTSEIYRQVEQVYEVLESLAVGQKINGDEHIILFIRLRENYHLTGELSDRIKKQIRTNTTPRHVPSHIYQVQDLPRTKNGKLSEIAVRQILNQQAIKNLDALVNPECLDQFKKFIIS